MFALIHEGMVWQTFDEDPNLTPGADVRDLTAVPDVQVGWLVTADGYAPPPQPAMGPIPQITRAQAKIHLLRVGLLDQVKVLLKDGSAEARLWFDEATMWSRTNPYVGAIGSELDLSEVEIDDLFRDAAKIDA